jgi:hypothetical protein
MELTGEWTIPVGGRWPIGVTYKGDDIPTGVTVDSVGTPTITPGTGITVEAPAVNAAKDGFSSWVTATTAGVYSVAFLVTRSDGGINVALGLVTVVATTKPTALATNALIAVADLARLLGEEVSTSLAEMVINSVSQEFERYLGRTIKQATSTALYLDGNGMKDLYLPAWPAAALGTVTEDGTLLTEGLTADFVLYTSNDSAYLHKMGGVWLEGPKTILISTVALGFATVPADLQLACAKQAAVEYQKSKLKGWNDTSRSIEGGSVSLVEPGLLPDVVAVLKRYQGYSI